MPGDAREITWKTIVIIVIMEVDIVHFYVLKCNFGRALKIDDDDFYEEWKKIRQE